MKKIAVILSGSGVFDGTEIHEAVLSLYAIELEGASWHCFAPNIDQHHVINHLTGEDMPETRNVLVEAARIARGQISDITTLNPAEYDALLLPGGFGVAKNLSDFAFAGADCTIHPDIKRVCQQFADEEKPAAYLCIAPTLIPLIYGPGAKGRSARIRIQPAHLTKWAESILIARWTSSCLTSNAACSAHRRTCWPGQFPRRRRGFKNW
ncbi:sigma cross-reacting protein 27A [Photobacterium aphoticum]|uniref:Sigma cross-reacting protein 27A n=1 Tax=Photobacterium aphoticum TaxID=754436 RepID=A0A090QZT9_9GAMM|nr:sigma cross-reacting protein 27A [Photobacterium aphoticum]